MSKWFWLALGLLLVQAFPAAAQQAQGRITVADCAAVSDIYAVNLVRIPIMDTKGRDCFSVVATGTFDDAAVGATGSAVPASASFDGINIAGTMQGWTGVNPSGSIYAGQIDIASVGGVTLLRGNGVTGTGSPRVTIASDNTPFHIIVDSSGLPTGAATVAAQTTGNNSLATVATNTGAAATNSLTNIATATTTTVKSGAGFLHTVCVNSLGTVASTVTIYDNTAGSGTKIATINSLALLGCQTYDGTFATGLTVVTTGTAAPDVTISWR